MVEPPVVSVWILIFAVEVVAKVLAGYLYRPLPDELACHHKTRAVKIELRKHRGPEAFVTKAKLERKLIALEKDATAFKGAAEATAARVGFFPCFLTHLGSTASTEARSQRKAMWESRFTRAKGGLYCIVVVLYWQRPLIVVGSWSLWPLGWLFRFPGHPPGSIGVMAGVFVGQQGCSRILNIFG